MRTDMTDRPAIKPLVWEEIHYNRSNEEPIPELTGWYAETEVGSYYVMLEGRIEVTLDGFQFHKVGSFDEPEVAFDAAQQDFGSRIRSCLLDKPEAVEMVGSRDASIERLVRALGDVIGHAKFVEVNFGISYAHLDEAEADFNDAA